MLTNQCLPAVVLLFCTQTKRYSATELLVCVYVYIQTHVNWLAFMYCVCGTRQDRLWHTITFPKHRRPYGGLHIRGSSYEFSTILFRHV